MPIPQNVIDSLKATLDAVQGASLDAALAGLAMGVRSAGETDAQVRERWMDEYLRLYSEPLSRNPYRTAPAATVQPGMRGAYSAQPPASPPKPKQYTKDDLIAQARRFGATYSEQHKRKDYWFLEVRLHNGELLSRSAYSEEQLQQDRNVLYRLIERMDQLNPYAKPARAGINDAARVACSRKPDTHGFHPINERCPYCP